MATNSLISVICSTYNRPDALSASLQGLLGQTDKNFEIIVADDGSTDETREVVTEFQERSAIYIQHVWHKDLGFRLAAIRNLALKHSLGEYVLFLDGDCIPSPSWVANHRKLAEIGWTVSGQRILTTQQFCQDILSNSEFVANLDWSISTLRGLCREKKINRWTPALNIGIHSLSFWRKARPNNWKMIRGCNWGMWRKDLETAHGFNEQIVGWGHEDADLAIRLMKNGVKFKSGSFATAVLHLWHKEASRSNAKQNWELATAQLQSSQSGGASNIASTPKQL